MVIGERFAWGHLQKTAGNATLGMFQLFPDLIVYADPLNVEDKHASFASRADQLDGKLLLSNMRRLAFCEGPAVIRFRLLRACWCHAVSVSAPQVDADLHTQIWI